METAARIDDFKFLAGNLALDFLNTRLDPDPGELVATFDGLLRWGIRAGTVTELEAHRLRQQAQTGPRAEESACARALELREALGEVFDAVIEGRRPSADAIVDLRSAESRAVAHGRLVRNGRTFEWTWGSDGDLG